VPQFATKRRVRHAASEMFDLVADMERYPEFVPLCRDLRVRRRMAGPEGTEIVIADMTAAYKLIVQNCITRVTLDRPDLQILVEYLEGPFSNLENRWVFHAVGDHLCDVEFFISYAFKSRALALLMGTMFDVAFRRFASAFEKRADTIYGRKAG